MNRISFTEYKTQTKALLLLSGPLIINNLSIAGIGFADAVMAGSIGARELAAVAVGSSFWFVGFLFCLGMEVTIFLGRCVYSREESEELPHLL